MSRWGAFVESFWEPRKGPVIFFAVAYLLGISVNVASSRIAASAQWIFAYVVPVVIVLFVISPWAVGVTARLFGVAEVKAASLRQARKYRGLVVFASAGAGISTARQAIEYHRPAHVWIFCSPQSENDARTLVLDLIARGVVAADAVHSRALSNEAFADPEEVRAAIESEVYASLDRFGLREGDVVIDFTGGKKETSAGALLAGLPPGRNLEVVRPRTVDQNLRGTDPGEVLEIDLRYKLQPQRRRAREAAAAAKVGA